MRQSDDTMHRITLRLPDALANSIEKYAEENEFLTTKQHAYRFFLEEGFNAIVGDRAKNYNRLAEISAASILENKYYLKQLYRIAFDAKKSKFDEPESEIQHVNQGMKDLIQSIIETKHDTEDDTERN